MSGLVEGDGAVGAALDEEIADGAADAGVDALAGTVGIAVGAAPPQATTSEEDERRRSQLPEDALESQLPPHHREPLVVDGDREPGRRQKSAVAALVASGRAPRSGYVSTAREPATARGRRRPPRRAAVRGRAPRASRVVAMQVITAGSGASGSCGYSSRSPLRPRIRRQRPELGVGRRLVVDQQDLGVAPEDAEPAAEELELARRLGARTRRCGAAVGRERVVGERVVVARERVERGRAGRGGANGLSARPALGANGFAGAWVAARTGSRRAAGRGRGRARLRKPRRARRLRPAVGILPVVARAVVEARDRRTAGSARTRRRR